jgi:ribosomal-protein-alanine N-acetyltransferase
MKSSSIDAFGTERLTAERLRPQHLADYGRLFQDVRVMATLSADGKPLPAEEVARWLQLSLDHWDRHHYGFWAIRTKEGNRFVGRAGLKNVDALGKNEVELAYALLPEFWDQGLATEISTAILEMAFKTIGLTEVVCFTLTTNLPSRRVMEKVGFQFEREGMHADLPHIFYRLTSAQFSANVDLKK